MNNINNIINKITEKVKSLHSSIIALDKNVNKLNQSINSEIEGISVNIQQTTNNLNKYLGKVNYTAWVDNVRNLSDAFNALSTSGVSFEQSMTNLSATTGIAGKELEDLNRIARETGKTSGVGAAAAAESFALLASQMQGSKVGMEGLKALQKETVTLTQASGLSMADAATAMTDTINQFGLGVNDANRVINVMAAASRQGSAGISDLSQSFKVAGSVAASAGLSVEQTAGALEVLSQSNLKGADAGAALRDIMLKLQTEMGMDLGETGLSSALEMLKPQLNDVAFLSKTFGEQNVQAAQFLISNAGAVNTMTTAITGTNMAQEQAAIRTATMAEKMKVWQAAIEDAKISIFNLTGGMSGYFAVIGDTAVMVAQMFPLFSSLRTVLSTLTLTNIKATAATAQKTVVDTAAAVKTKALTVAQGALNAVMNLNPIALIVTALAALVAIFITAYNNCEGFRLTVDKAWESVKQFAAVVWDSLVEAFASFAKILGGVWEKLKVLFRIETESAAVAEGLAESTEKVAKATGKVGKAQSDATVQSSGFIKTLEAQNNQLNTNLDTLGGVEQKIADLKAAQKNASLEQAVALEKEIHLWEEKQKAMENAILIGGAERPEMKRIEAPSVEVPDLTEVNEKVKASLESTKEQIRNAAGVTSAEMAKMAEQKETFPIFQQGFGGIASVMQHLSGVVGESAGAWLSWGGSLMQTVAQAIPQIIALGNTQIASATAQTQANTSVAATGAAASVAAIPVVGWIMAASAVASVIAALASIPKPKAFALGGIVYGNTFAQVGEYPGAANNPEVIAPLSKLKRLIQPVSSGGGVYEFRLRGRDFVAVAAKYDNINNRTR